MTNMRIPEHILKKAFEIGFVYKKECYWENPFCSVPCEVKLKNGETYEVAELILLENSCFKFSFVFTIVNAGFAISLVDISLSGDAASTG